MKQIVSFTSVTKQYGSAVILDNLFLKIYENDVIGVLGPSGVGKSTMMKLIGGIEQPSHGSVRNNALRVGYVFQEPRLLPWKTAIENVMLPMQALKISNEEAVNAATSTLSRMGLADHLHYYPKHLSGGMIQRVSLARALAIKPDLLLMDEPFAAIDLRLKELLIYFLKEHLNRHPATVVYISHAPDEILQIANRILIFEKEYRVDEIKPKKEELLNYYSQSVLSNFMDSELSGGQHIMNWLDKKDEFQVIDGRNKTMDFLPEMLELAEKIESGSGIKVIQNFEPVPLYFQLEKMGFERHTDKISDSEYHAYFYKVGTEDKEQPIKMAEYIKVDPVRADKIAEMVISFFNGTPVEKLQPEYDKIAPVTASEFAFAEQMISDQGVPDEQFESHINSLITMYRSSLDQANVGKLPAGHPVNTFMLENVAITDLVNEIRAKLSDANFDIEYFTTAYKKLKTVNNHYVRKEHQLFPYLERKGFEKPSTVMWSLHDKIRDSIKMALSLLDKGDIEQFNAVQDETLTEIIEMIYKEEKILFPTSLEMLSVAEWKLLRKGEIELEYCLIDKPVMWGADAESQKVQSKPVGVPVGSDSGVYVKLGEGMLTLEQINAIFSHLPVDISYVDQDDRVRFYNQTEHRVFPRSPDVIGREVRFCHPPKSVDTVLEIISEFRAGNKNEAEFWLTLNDRFLHIRYYAVRSSDGTYMGVLEMMQDVTDIRSLEGNQTLLTWKK